MIERLQRKPIWSHINILYAASIMLAISLMTLLFVSDTARAAEYTNSSANITWTYDETVTIHHADTWNYKMQYAIQYHPEAGNYCVYAQNYGDDNNHGNEPSAGHRTSLSNIESLMYERAGYGHYTNGVPVEEDASKKHTNSGGDVIRVFGVRTSTPDTYETVRHTIKVEPVLTDSGFVYNVSHTAPANSNAGTAAINTSKQKVSLDGVVSFINSQSRLGSNSASKVSNSNQSYSSASFVTNNIIKSRLTGVNNDSVINNSTVSNIEIKSAYSLKIGSSSYKVPTNLTFKLTPKNYTTQQNVFVGRLDDARTFSGNIGTVKLVNLNTVISGKTKYDRVADVVYNGVSYKIYGYKTNTSNTIDYTAINANTLNSYVKSCVLCDGVSNAKIYNLTNTTNALGLSSIRHCDDIIKLDNCDFTYFVNDQAGVGVTKTTLTTGALNDMTNHLQSYHGAAKIVSDNNSTPDVALYLNTISASDPYFEFIETSDCYYVLYNDVVIGGYADFTATSDDGTTSTTRKYCDVFRVELSGQLLTSGDYKSNIDTTTYATSDGNYFLYKIEEPTNDVKFSLAAVSNKTSDSVKKVNRFFNDDVTITTDDGKTVTIYRNEDNSEYTVILYDLFTGSVVFSSESNTLSYEIGSPESIDTIDNKYVLLKYSNSALTLGVYCLASDVDYITSTYFNKDGILSDQFTLIPILDDESDNSGSTQPDDSESNGLVDIKYESTFLYNLSKDAKAKAYYLFANSLENPDEVFADVNNISFEETTVSEFRKLAIKVDTVSNGSDAEYTLYYVVPELKVKYLLNTDKSLKWAHQWYGNSEVDLLEDNAVDEPDDSGLSFEEKQKESGKSSKAPESKIDERKVDSYEITYYVDGNVYKVYTIDKGSAFPKLDSSKYKLITKLSKTVTGDILSVYYESIPDKSDKNTTKKTTDSDTDAGNKIITVTFIDKDGNVVKTSVVKQHTSASKLAPDGYSWDIKTDDLTSDTVIYELTIATSKLDKSYNTKTH